MVTASDMVGGVRGGGGQARGHAVVAVSFVAVAGGKWGQLSGGRRHTFSLPLAVIVEMLWPHQLPHQLAIEGLVDKMRANAHQKSNVSDAQTCGPVQNRSVQWSAAVIAWWWPKSPRSTATEVKQRHTRQWAGRAISRWVRVSRCVCVCVLCAVKHSFFDFVCTCNEEHRSVPPKCRRRGDDVQFGHVEGQPHDCSAC